VTGDSPAALADFLRRLKTAEPSFSNNDATIAAFLRQNPFLAALCTAEQLARQTAVSKAAIVRFATRLGYSGFSALRDELRQRALGQRVEPPTLLDDESLDAVNDVLSTKLASDVESLSTFVEGVDQRELWRCATLLAQPGARVFVTGHWRGFALAVLAHRQLNWVRSGVRLWRTEELGLALALDQIVAGDVVLAFAFRRYPRVTGVVLEYARAIGATSILVSDSLTCPYVDLGDCVLLCASGGSPAFDSLLPAVFCIETLAGLMVHMRSSDVDDRIRLLHDAAHASRLEDADAHTQPEALPGPVRPQ
jgi:DNA-binding MurR/RpiR family transcriptional regulator